MVVVAREAEQGRGERGRAADGYGQDAGEGEIAREGGEGDVGVA